MTIATVLVSCEHGGHRVPARWAHRFAGGSRVLASHRGWDRGAIGMARRVARRLDAPLFAGTVTRLLVELNRSEHHPQLFSRYTRTLPPEEKRVILARHYHPYRQAVERAAEEALRRGRVLHVSFHTFTPVLRGVVRRTDVGVLYDPARPAERDLAGRWVERLRRTGTPLRVRRNDPYRGTADGLTTALRRRLGPRYLGLELEVSQRFFDADGRPRSAAVVAGIEATLPALLGG